MTITSTPKRFSTWVRTFRPISNPLYATALYDGKMFETLGSEFDFVRRHEQLHPRTVWTLCCDYDRHYITPGLHIVNRLGYFICAVPYTHQLAFANIPA